MFKKNVLGIVGVFLLPLVASATEYQTVERPRQQCWNEQVAVNSSGYGGAVLGGVAGGLLGNQIGGGRGRTVATAVGAATGAVVGDRMSANGVSYQTVQRCRTVMVKERVPVYYQPQQELYDDVPIYRPRTAYYAQERGESWKREQWQREHSKRKHWRHEHEDGDDEDEGHGHGHHGHYDDDD
jgi:hypothetical protein